MRPVLSIRLLRPAVAAALSLPAAARAQVYDVAADWSSSNPSGVWTYGWKPSSLGAFTPYTLFTTATGTLDVHTNNGTLTPGVFKNVGAAPVVFSGTLQYDPGEAGFHPGSAGELSVYRFTAPSAGSYTLTSRFYGLDFVGPTDTRIFVTLPEHVLTFGVGTVHGYRAPSEITFGQLLTLNPGDHVDFEVDYNGNYLFDSTAIDARLTFGALAAVPEPGTVALLGAGLAGLGALRCRRRAAWR
jgi:hypothetical protein